MVSKSVLVTGSNGYIGREVCLQFRNAGWTVYGACRSQEKFDNAFLAQEEIIPVITDYKNVEALLTFVEKSEVIIECATTTPSQEIIETMINLVKKSGNCSDGTKKLFIQTTGFMQHQFEPFVLEQKEIITAIIRPGFIYGKSGGQVFEHLFFKKPPVGEKLNIAGNKDKVWGWCHIIDLAKFYVIAAQKKTQIQGQTYKVGKLIPSCTYEKIIKEIASCMNVDVKYDGEPQGFEIMVKDLHMDEFYNENTLELGWEPRFSCNPVQDMKIHYGAFLAWKNQK